MVLCLEQEFCKKLYQSLDKIDEDRYDAEAKVEKTNKEVERHANTASAANAANWYSFIFN